MKNVTKITLGLLFLFLIVGSVCAFDVDSLKVPFGYSDLKDGNAMLNDGHTIIYVGKMSDNPGVFDTDIENKYVVTDIGNNTFYFVDELLSMYGLQEKVKIDGTEYVVCVYKDAPLSEADKTLLHDDLDSFNEKNNLKPIAV